MLNFLWTLAAAFSGWLSKMTPSKAAGVIAFCVIAWAFAHIFPLELALVMGGDWAVYFELLAAVGLVTANVHVRNALGRLAPAASRVSRWTLLRVRILGMRMATRARARSRRTRATPIRRRRAEDDDSTGPVPAFA
ncbi:MAG TPA: hypothetical protein VFC47_14135 [Caulobacteraceae bacterium]|nr:hypothetical protein [Caulobacteraceae bacterium]